jgi:thiol peroxidase
VAASERVGAITGKGKPLTLVGNEVKVGEDAPAFSAVANDMSTYRFDPKSGQVLILSSVPSLDTGVCSRETRRFNEEATGLGENIKIVTISMDLPFAQKRWCGAEGVKNVQTVSDYKDREFGEKYGMTIKETGLLARAVFVVDRQGKLKYVEVVKELGQEPDYAAVIAAAKEAAGIGG